VVLFVLVTITTCCCHTPNTAINWGGREGEKTDLNIYELWLAHVIYLLLVLIIGGDGKNHPFLDWRSAYLG
jgi:hypothetical protein